MKTNCYICDKELPENNHEIETLETPNLHWDLCLDCFLNLEKLIGELIEKIKDEETNE